MTPANSMMIWRHYTSRRMKRLSLAATLLLFTGCAHFQALDGGNPRDRAELWSSAHYALSRRDFSGAEATFERLSTEFRGTIEGRESLFYLGAIRLDPRNDDWDPEIAEARFETYLSHMRDGGARLYRYPEGITLHEIARQLNLPPDSRVAALQPEERVVTVEERVLVPAQQSQDLAAEVERLRREVAERDVRIRQQQEELERIRRTLTSPGR